MKQDEIKQCALCKRGVMHAGSITFFRARIERMVVDLNAVRRQHGLEMMIGGLGTVMGPDEDLAKPLGEACDIFVCEPCALNPTAAPCFFSLYEAGTTEGGENGDDEVHV